jgi:1,4-alpha-glucan branching enzyme
MKHNKNQDNVKSDGPQLEPVHFEFTHPTARAVCIAGTFNDWQPEAKPMHPSGNGHWLKETALAPGTYEYCLVVDGQWMPDPLAKDYVSNPFGGRNSVLKVASSSEAAHLADAENLPLKNANKQKTQKIWTHKHKQSATP